MKYVLAVAIALMLGGCTTMQKNDFYARLAECQSRFDVLQNADGNLVQVPKNCSHVQPNSDASMTGTAVAGVVGITALIVWLIVELADNQNASQIAAPVPQNPLVPVSTTQTTTSSVDYIQPVYLPIPTP